MASPLFHFAPQPNRRLNSDANTGHAFGIFMASVGALQPSASGAGYGLVNYPGRIDLLDDLSFFHEFENILSLLISYYTRACVTQGNLDTFAELAREFY